MTYFDSFEVFKKKTSKLSKQNSKRNLLIIKSIKKFINNKNIIANIFRIQAYDSVMCRYFCIGFIDFMLKGNNLTNFTNLFSPNNLKKNDDIILNYFPNKL